MKKKKDVVWVDEDGFDLSLDEIVEELKLTRIVNRNLHDLLCKNKIGVVSIAAAYNEAKKQMYNLTKPQEQSTQKKIKKK
jgi:hypothetical protein